MTPCMQFVEDGRERHRAAIAPSIKAEVIAEFAGRLESASRLERWRLRFAMRREIRRRIAAAASRRALY
jgi:hypothetical protein